MEYAVTRPPCPALRLPAALPERQPLTEPLRGRSIAERMALIEQTVPVQRRIVRPGDVVYQAGQAFGQLFVVNAGFFKVLQLAADGREQIVSLKFRGDWMGIDGLADGTHDGEAVAIDVGEVWTVAYDALLRAGAARPALMATFHEAMGREIARERHSLMSVCGLPADARVADFLRTWARGLSGRGLRTDQITLRMTRAEIGNYLGVTLETVSRALSRLHREGLIRFVDKGRRDLRIPDVEALEGFAQRCTAPVTPA